VSDAHEGIELLALRWPRNGRLNLFNNNGVLPTTE
jgi:hypothetical protein